MGNEFSEKVLDHIKKNGPSLPIEISSSLGGNTLFAGAILSELVSRKIIKISNAKIGGSPVYYLPGQESKLLYLRKYLSERPRMAFDILKENQVLHDKSCEPWQRVALREIKDFAFSFEVEINGNKEIFWRWYLLPEEEAKKKIFNNSLESEIKNIDENTVKEKPKEEVKEEPKEEVKEEPKKEIKKEVKKEQDKQTKIIEDSSTKIPDKKDEFYNLIFEFFMENDIKVIKQNEIKKGKEIHFQIHLNTPMGEIPFMVLAKEKKNINKKDLSLAFSQLYHYKMPIIYLSTGDLAKTGEKFLKEELKGITFKKI